MCLYSAIRKGAPIEMEFGGGVLKAVAYAAGCGMGLKIFCHDGETREPRQTCVEQYTENTGTTMIVVVLPMVAVLTALCCIQSVRLIYRWKVGRGITRSLLRGVVGVPHAYFHHVHDVVSREPRAARMHASLVGGCSATLLLVLCLSFDPDSWLLLALLLAAEACCFAGIVLLVQRRWIDLSAHLSRGAYQSLPLVFMLTLLFFAELTWLLCSPTSSSVGALILLVALAFAGPGWLLALAVNGPMRHAFAGITHLAAHSRPERLERTAVKASATALKPLDLSEQGVAGSGRIADFSWNRLASFDSCVQCGRCEAVCPANAAGLPLNPKKFINDLALGMAVEGSVQNYAGNAHPGQSGALVSGGPLALFLNNEQNLTGWIAQETVWACTTCRACVYECPMLIEHVDAVVDVRRHQVIELGLVPGRAPEALANLRETDTLGGHALRERCRWAVDLQLPRMAEVKQADCLLWVGEGGYDARHQKSLRALVALLRKAGIDFAVLGNEELDCGDAARRLGDEATFERLVDANIGILSRYRFSRILTADPHVLHCLSKEYPARGGCYEVVHHTTFLAELVKLGRLEPLPADGFDVTYHDPCYLGRYSGELASPRFLLAEMGGVLKEMERSGLRSSCCGGGGGAPLTEIAGKSRIPDIRMDHARATGANRIAVACPGCMSMLGGVPGDKPEVVDIAELLLARVA